MELSYAKTIIEKLQIFYIARYIVTFYLTHTIYCAIIYLYLSFLCFPVREPGQFIQNTRKFKFGN